ncbi:MAG: lipopolysaccharide biosynthesis protein [Rhodopseudomonas palustris]|uniref:Lipopolysaccharide biosynthesis protein n=1 Tax=Rhodopseudomonas palustris TaxID=1076 RepID=A0A933VX84_RHOPL|nr:lipopolysaccharide biosynthesis protein [Rhodopseudomonas palustris]
MFGRPAGQGTASRTAREAPSSWESPGDLAALGQRAKITGSITAAGVTRFARRNGRKIASLAVMLFALGVLVLWMIPVRYAATALVVVDPREQRVTTDQEVLPGIGQDAAALQSLIEIAKSDGFLRPLVEKLKVANDREIAGDETDPSRVLEKFRKHLEISRRGVTYVIAMTFVSKDPERAASYANAIAEAFVTSQTQVRTAAADEAAVWLNSRMKGLSEKLRASEDAVAAFKTRYRIVNAGRESTTRQLRVTELSQQASTARLRTEEAKSRYDQAQRDLKTNLDGSAGSKSDLLSILRAQRSQLNDQIAQKRAVLGDRHPDLVISSNQLVELDRQIEAERKRNVASAKSDYEAMLEQQKVLEQQLKALEGEMLVDGEAAVKLQELQREADANRSIYEQFLSRYNATNQQRLLQATQTKVASFATPPTRPTRPSLALLLVALVIASILAATAIVAILESLSSGTEEVVDVGGDERSAASAETLPSSDATPEVPPSPNLPVLARIPDLSGPLVKPGKQALREQAVDLRDYVGDVVNAIGADPAQRGRIVLVTSPGVGDGKSSVARALNAAAIDRGLLSVVIEVISDRAMLRGSQTGGKEQGAVRTLKTTVASLLRVMSAVATDASGEGDIRREFDLVLIDAPSLAEQPDVATISGRADFNLLVFDEAVTDPAMVLEARAKLSHFGHAPIGVVVNRMDMPTSAANETAKARLAS